VKNKEIKETVYKNVYQNASEGYVLTPSELAFEMVSTLPNEVFESHSTTFLDPICKSGTFLFEIAEKLYNEGHSIGNIEKRIYTVDGNSHSLNIANSYIKRILNKESGSFGVDFKSDFSESFFNYAVGVVSGGRFKTFSEFINTILIDKKYNYLMVQLKRNISEFIERYEKVSKLESKLFGEVFTPRQLIDEMLDTLPAEVWKNKDLKWLDPAVGIGNFPAAILDRLMVGLEGVISDEDERRKWILEEMLYMCDISIKNLFLLYKLFDENNEFKLNVYRGSFLEEDFDKWMKEVWGLEGFDVCVGNPPYQSMEIERKTNGGNNKKLWPIFLKKTNDFIFDNGYNCIVIPSTWAAGAKNPLDSTNIFNDIVKKYNTIKIKLDCRKYFNVGIDISYLIINKKEISGPLTTQIENFNISDLRSYDMLPKTIESISIFEKIKNSEKFEFSMVRKDFKIKELSNFYTEEFKYKTWVGREGFKYSKESTRFDLDRKILTHRMGSLCIVNDEYGEITPNYSQVYILKENESGENSKNLFNTKLYRFLYNNLKYTQYNESRSLNQLPKVDLSKSWTDLELYEHFNLTQEEIDLIEKTIKD